jgi:uncharacterized protein (DUF2147 family)
MRAAASIALTALVSLALALFAPLAEAGEADDAIFGVWGTQGMNAKVNVGRCQDAGITEHICGTITWLWEPMDRSGRPKTDSENPDERLRNRSLIGVQILSGFRRSTSGKLSGKIYNPENGRTYEATMRLQGSDTLIVEGCVLFICEKQIWRRASSICERP